MDIPGILSQAGDAACVRSVVRRSQYQGTVDQEALCLDGEDLRRHNYLHTLKTFNGTIKLSIA